MDNETKIVKSVYDSNYEAISNIMYLYNIEKFDLDCTYSKGSFWKNLPEPTFKSDLIPINDTVIEANSENLPFEDNSFKSIMYDPPFVIAGKTYKDNKNGSSIIAKRFEGYENYNLLMKNYYLSLKELYRICDKGGYVVMKCQDTVSGGKNHFTHNLIFNIGLHLGFYPRDLFILNSNRRINSFGGKWKKQEHARKYHSYFIVFEKIKPRVNYDFLNFDVNQQDSLEFQDID